MSFTGDRTLIVAMVDPANVLAIDDIAVMTGYEVRPAVASLADVERLLQRLEDPNFGDGAVAPEELEIADDPAAAPAPAAPAAPLYDIRENQPINFGAAGEDSSVIQLVHRVIAEAVDRGASDIHVEPAGSGNCGFATASTACSTTVDDRAQAHPGRVVVASRSSGNMDIAERRVPQDGRIALRVDKREIDLRVSLAADARTARRSSCASSTSARSMVELEELGLLPQALGALRRALSQAARHQSWSRARPAAARRRRCTPSLNRLNTTRRTSSRSRTRSSTS